MKRTEDVLPEGASPSFDAERGQEVVFVTADAQFGTWRAPYCGPRSFTAPKFTATRARLKELEGQLAARVPAGSTARIVQCTKEAEDGTAEWAAVAFVDHSSPMLAGD